MSKKQGVFSIALITALLLFKVYLSNYIYLKSRNIQKVRTKIDALKEEQSILKIKIEKLKYQNEISDPLFNFETTEETHSQEQVEHISDIKKGKTKQINKNRLFDNLEVDILEGY